MTDISIRAGQVSLEGSLVLPGNARGVIVFVHGSGSSRWSPRNQYVAGFLNEGGLGTLLFDLLTPQENEIDAVTRALRFDIDLLAGRLVAVLDSLARRADTHELRVGLFGASTGAAAALIAAAERPDRVAAVVSRGGRPDLAMDALPLVGAPTLLIVGGLDGPVIGMNRKAAARFRTEYRIEIVPGATHLFEEPGKLEEVARLARDWFQQHLAAVTHES